MNKRRKVVDLKNNPTKTLLLVKQISVNLSYCPKKMKKIPLKFYLSKIALPKIASKVAISRFFLLFILIGSSHHLIAQQENNEQEQRLERLREQEITEIEENQAIPIQQVKEKKAKPYVSEKRLKKMIDSLVKKTGKEFAKALKCKYDLYQSTKGIRKFGRFSARKFLCFNFPNSILLTSINVYNHHKDTVDLRYLNEKLLDIKIEKFKFDIQRSRNTFKLRQILEADSYRIVRGAVNTRELSQFVLEEGFDHYAEFYLYVFPRRIVLETYIFDAKTHQIKWSTWKALRYKPSYLDFSFSTRAELGSRPMFVTFRTTAGPYIPRFGEMGIFFDTGIATGKPPAGSAVGGLPNIFINLSVGGYAAINMVELITGNNYCCDIALTTSPGIFFDVPIIGAGDDVNAAGNTTTRTRVRNSLTAFSGLKVIIQDFFITGEYDPIRKVGALGFGYRF